MTDLSERMSIGSTSSHRRSEDRDHRRPTRRRSSKSIRSSHASTSASSRASNDPANRSRLTKMPATTQRSIPRQNLERQDAEKHHRSDGKRQSSSKSTDSFGRRRSTLTTSSDSTKLGEIRHRDMSKPNQATYPLWTYPREPVKLKKGRLFGLFSH